MDVDDFASDGIPIMYWKKLNCEAEFDALADDPASTGEPRFARLACRASGF
jgi:hypothetical protein